MGTIEAETDFWRDPQGVGGEVEDEKDFWSGEGPRSWLNLALDLIVGDGVSLSESESLE